MARLTHVERTNRQTGLSISLVVHILILLAFIFIKFGGVAPMPQPVEQGGILVALGEPDRGQGDDPAPEGQQMDDPTQTQEVAKPEPAPTKPTPPAPQPKSTPAPSKPTKNNTPPPSKVVTEDPSVVKARQEADARKREKAAEDQRRADAKAKADAAAAAAKAKADKAAADAAAKAKAEADAKGKFGSKFGKGTGGGQGNTGKPGNQGDPNGDPNSKVLEGISTGSGTIGGGLGNRPVKKKAPKPTDNTNAEGTVVVKVCVNNSGKVISAEVTQKGTTTTDAKLRAKAVANAKQYEFEGADMDNQCGTITYVFTAQ